MEIKCPKCRFKFIDKIPSGVNEFSCVCPRCGIPFTICLKQISREGNPSSISQETVPPSITGQKFIGHNSGRDTSPKEKQQNETDVPPKLSANFRTSKKRDKYLLRLIVAFIVSIFFVAFLLHFVLGRYVKAPEVDVFSEETMEGVHDIDTSSIYTKIPNRIHDQPVPQWIKGVWKGEAQFYNITLEINDNKIIEHCGNKKAQGTFQYDHGRLFCRFPENGTFTYLIDEDSHTISAGEGILLHK